MSEIKIFEKEEFGAIRTVIDQDQEPWFVAKDVCEVLGIQNASDTISKVLDEDEKGVDTIYTPGGPQDLAIINESGLYSLILRSRKPESKRFKKWVTSEVLPSIRKTGQYSVQLSPAEFLLQQAQILLDVERKTNEALAISASTSKRLDNIETAHDHFTVMGFCSYSGKSVSLETAKRIGKRASKLCREMGIEMGSVPDPRFGRANTYPAFILRDILENN